jgi:hypothetical protein
MAPVRHLKPVDDVVRPHTADCGFAGRTSHVGRTVAVTPNSVRPSPGSPAPVVRCHPHPAFATAHRSWRSPATPNVCRNQFHVGPVPGTTHPTPSDGLVPRSLLGPQSSLLPIWRVFGGSLRSIDKHRARQRGAIARTAERQPPLPAHTCFVTVPGIRAPPPKMQGCDKHADAHATENPRRSGPNQKMQKCSLHFFGSEPHDARRSNPPHQSRTALHRRPSRQPFPD